MVSAVILAYNRIPELLITIDKLKSLALSLPFELEIIVVDNASVDGTSGIVSFMYPDVKLVTKPINNGIAGWNEGLAVAKYEYMLVLDDDSCIESGLPDAIGYMDQNHDIGILALDIVDMELKGDPNLDPDKAWKDKQEIVGFIGCGAVIRKSLYEKIGGYAEWIYMYTHEFEFAIRCINAGSKVKFFKAAKVIHRTSKLNRSNKRMRIYASRNEMAIVHKYFRRNKIKYIFRVFVNNLKFVKREGIRSGWYVFLGLISFLKLRNSLQPTPVNEQTQDFYADHFWSTKAIISK